MLSDKELETLNYQGIIPGPNESLSDYTKRSVYCLDLRKELTKRLVTEISLNEEQNETQNIILEAFPQTRLLYDIVPTWLPVIFTNEKLSFWHGGCAWIFQLDDETPTGALLQLRQNFRDCSTYLGIYKRQELIAHEISHVGRMTYEEPEFEEMLAYRSSCSWFRRYFGPIVQSAKESLLFLSSIILILVLDFFFITSGAEKLYEWAMWIKIVPIAILGYGLVRLFLRHRQFSQCLHNLRQLVEGDNKANAVIYRLTDREIKNFSKWSTKEISKYIHEQSKDNFRWKFIHKIYFG